MVRLRAPRWVAANLFRPILSRMPRLSNQLLDDGTALHLHDDADAALDQSSAMGGGRLPSMPHPRKKRVSPISVAFHRRAQPGAGILPIPIGNRPRNAERCAGLLDRELAEQMHLSNLGRQGVLGAESCEQLVERQDQIEVLDGRAGLVEEVASTAPTAPFQAVPIAGMVDEDA